MLHPSSDNRNARAHPADRPRGRGRARGGSNSSELTRDAFEQERRENAAKREQRGQPATDSRQGGRGAPNNRGVFSKSFHSQENARVNKEIPAPASGSSATSKKITSTTLGSPAFPPSTNTTKNSPTSSNNSFGRPNGASSMAKPFGAPSPLASSSIFGAPSSRLNGTSPTSSVFGAPSQSPNPFGAPPTSKRVQPPPSNPFAAASQKTKSPFGGTTNGTVSEFMTAASSAPASSVFGGSSGASVSAPSSIFTKPSQTTFGAPSQFPSSLSGKSTTGAAFGAPKNSSPAANTFGAPSQTRPAFGTPLQSSSPTNPFGASSKPTPAFGAPSQPTSAQPFGAPSKSATFGASITSNQPSSSALKNGSKKFGGSSSTAFSGFPSSPTTKLPAIFGAPTSSLFTPKETDTSMAITSSIARNTNAQSQSSSLTAALEDEPREWLTKLANHLQKEGIIRPEFPGPNPGDPKAKAKVETFYRGPLRKYRANVRTSLMRADLMDDPDKRRRLADAINFRGTCEDLCPYNEVFERIIEGSTIASLEKERSSTGALWPAKQNMVKKHSRSAAGEETPLPEDVRTPRTLRRTIDYLFKEVLGEDEDLRKVHGFLWDRSRAVRRDFTFQQAALTTVDLQDHVYCLEQETRYHVIALHQMSKSGLAASDFSEQQEIEQLSKALISLNHVYQDCRDRKVECARESEFQAYYALYNSQNPSNLKAVQVLGEDVWTAWPELLQVSALIEALNTITNSRGPLKPFSRADSAENAFTKFFGMVESKEISYTMACFAEIHFKKVRKAALSAIARAYRKQRDQTKDWTLAELNKVLRFDDDEDVVSFVEAYGLRFEEIDGEKYLSIDVSESVSDPFPPLKQMHSWDLVERKRGNRSLPELIENIVFEDDDSHFIIDTKGEWSDESYEQADEVGETGIQEEEEESLFIPEEYPQVTAPVAPQLPSLLFGTGNSSIDEKQAAPVIASQPTAVPAATQSVSVLDNVKPVKSFGSDFFTQSQPTAAAPNNSFFPPPSGQNLQETQSPFPQTTNTPSTSTAGPALFSFFKPGSPTTSEAPPKPTLSLGNYAVPKAPTSPLPPMLGNYKVTKSPPAPTVEATSESSILPQLPQHQAPLPSPLFDAPAPTQVAVSTPSFPAAPVSVPVTRAPSTLAALGPPPVASFVAPAAAVPAPNTLTPPASFDVVPQAVFLPSSQSTVALIREQKFDTFTNWFVNGEDGIIQHFKEHSLEKILKQVFEQHQDEEAIRKEKEADELANRQADNFRYFKLASRFGDRWRRTSRLLRVRRRAKEDRQLLQEMAEAARARKAEQAANLVNDFNASTQATLAKKQKVENLLEELDATGALNGVRNAKETIRDIVNPSRNQRRSEQLREQSRKNRSALSNSVDRSKSASQSVGSARSSVQQKASRPDNPLRRTMGSDPSYLRGESRIYHMKDYMANENRRQVSGVQTDYFRLKARGIATLPDGTPLANSVAKEPILHKKHSFDGVTKPEMRRPTPSKSFASSYSGRHFENDEAPVVSVEPIVDVEAIKATVRAMVEKERTSKKRRSVDIDDDDDEPPLYVPVPKRKKGEHRPIEKEVEEVPEGQRTSKKRRSIEIEMDDDELELVARMKRVKDRLDEDSKWYREQRELLEQQQSQEKDSPLRLSRSGSWGSFYSRS